MMSISHRRVDRSCVVELVEYRIWWGLRKTAWETVGMWTRRWRAEQPRDGKWNRHHIACCTRGKGRGVGIAGKELQSLAPSVVFDFRQPAFHQISKHLDRSLEKLSVTLARVSTK
jgi:hypothetical protein